MARRLVVPKAARSEVWKYFGFAADESGKISDIDSRLGRRFVWCRLCDTQLVFSGNTTNLFSHISRCHNIKIQMERTLPIPVESKIQNINYSEAWSQTKNLPQDFNKHGDIQQPEIEMSVDEEIVDVAENNTSEDQQYCLKWKHHHINQQTMFARLLEQKSFCDVTIACEEKLIRAHKLVLSACSSYFEMVLSHYEDQNPIIILKDVKYEDMLTIVQFMYRGEVNIVQSHLATFLEIADVLKVRGLSDIHDESLHQSPPPLEKDGLSNSGIKQEQGKRPLMDEETQRQVKIARCSTGMKVNPAVATEVGGKEMRKENKSAFVSAEENTTVNNISDTQEDIIRLPQFLIHGSYKEFWNKPWVLKALKAVNDGEMTLRKCSELLGVNYNNLYSRYKILHGSLKEPSYDTSPSTSRGYTLNIVNSYSKKEASGNIIVTREKTAAANNSNSSRLGKDRGRIVLRADELTSKAVLNVKEEHSTNQELVMKVEVEDSGHQFQYTTENNSDDHVLEFDCPKNEDAYQM